MTVSERFRRALPALYLLLLLIVAQGCASQATFQFACEPGNEINGGLLLTIDVVVIDDSEERQIRQLGDDWFYSDLRRSLPDSRKKTRGVEAGCRETVIVPHLKGFERLAVIADYQFEGRGQGKAQMEFYGKDSWQGKQLRVRVFDRYLTISQAR